MQLLNSSRLRVNDRPAIKPALATARIHRARLLWPKWIDLRAASLTGHLPEHRSGVRSTDKPLRDPSAQQPYPAMLRPVVKRWGRRNALAGLKFLELLNIEMLMVPRKGLEPSQPLSYWHLKPARLPIPPPGHAREHGAG